MSASWILSMKPSFLTDWQELAPKVVRQIADKLKELTSDPTPDGKMRKRLEHLPGKICRVRSGDYRIFYTFEKPYVSVLAVRKRDESTYQGTPEGENLGGPKSLDEAEVPVDASSGPPPKPTWSEQIDLPKREIEKTPLPQPITEELLQRLRVPAAYRGALLRITTEDDLLNCGDVPDEFLLRIDQALGQPALESIAQQPDYIAQDVDDLVRYKNGELSGFLLRLDPDQAKFVEWGIDASGPTLLKGGPGTGKSVIALYRAQAMVSALRREGVSKPRLLFTTYTNALVAYCRQLLGSLMGPDASLITVRTADSIAREIALGNKAFEAVTQQRLREILTRAISATRFDGSSIQQKAQTQTIDRLGPEYLLEEILSVIDGRGLRSLAEYEQARRPGRSVALNRTQRGAVWRVRTTFHDLLAAEGRHTWQSIRLRASNKVVAGEATRYDGVIVDEAQDLDPTLVRMLAGLCKSPNRLFFTADADQSIYGSGFRWQDVHEDLRFQGRTGVLRANYRSTREIGEAASAYLANGALDEERVVQTFVRSGPLPAVRAVGSAADEIKLLERFIRTASKELHLGMGACAVLVPTNDEGARIATALQERRMGAAFMSGKDLDLRSKSVKVITLKSAKGLEFPCVALAGFVESGFPVYPAGTTEEGAVEIDSRERRTLFVAMTRAMHSLLVVVPTRGGSPLLAGFDPKGWNLGDRR